MKLHYEDRLVFTSQTGKSDRVCTKDLSIGEALMNIYHLQLDTCEDGSYELNCDDENLNDSMILHRAAGILHSSMANISFYSDCYPPSGEYVSGQQMQVICSSTSVRLYFMVHHEKGL
jgi:hypothetical protein